MFPHRLPQFFEGGEIPPSLLNLPQFPCWDSKVAALTANSVNKHIENQRVQGGVRSEIIALHPLGGVGGEGALQSYLGKVTNLRRVSIRTEKCSLPQHENKPSYFIMRDHAEEGPLNIHLGFLVV